MLPFLSTHPSESGSLENQDDALCGGRGDNRRQCVGCVWQASPGMSLWLTPAWSVGGSVQGNCTKGRGDPERSRGETLASGCGCFSAERSLEPTFVPVRFGVKSATLTSLQRQCALIRAGVRARVALRGPRRCRCPAEPSSLFTRFPLTRNLCSRVGLALWSSLRPVFAPKLSWWQGLPGEQEAGVRSFWVHRRRADSLVLSC